jgi:hypothetical protein
MKKLIKVSALAIVLLAGATGAMSFTTNQSVESSITIDNIQFKLINDTPNEVGYCVGDTHYSIKKDQSVGFSFAAGTTVKKYSDDKCDAVWFKISSDMHGKSIKVSELK